MPRLTISAAGRQGDFSDAGLNNSPCHRTVGEIADRAARRHGHVVKGGQEQGLIGKLVAGENEGPISGLGTDFFTTLPVSD